MKKTIAQKPQDAFLNFKKSVKTLNLSTLDREAKPRASYAPFIEGEEGSFYIFVSQLASHTQDLLENSQASILLLQDEKETRQIFARQRISYQCQAEVISPDNSEYKIILDSMEERFGNIMELLRTLPDFILFRLQPYEGLYVKGFGKAFKLTGEGLLELEHITSETS